VLGGQASANPNLNCAVYASEAIKEITQAEATGCGYGGNAWRNDYQFHFNWCQSAGVTINDLGREDQARLAALATCKQQHNAALQNPMGNGACDFYAKNMVGLAITNATRACGFGGGRFDVNYQAHFNWCKNGASRDQLRSELKAASQAIGQCLKSSQAPTSDPLQTPSTDLYPDHLCKGYAGIMVGYARDNLVSGCGFADSLFADNFDGHYKWCAANPDKTIPLNAIFNAFEQIRFCKLAK